MNVTNDAGQSLEGWSNVCTTITISHGRAAVQSPAEGWNGIRVAATHRILVPVIFRNGYHQFALQRKGISWRCFRFLRSHITTSHLSLTLDGASLCVVEDITFSTAKKRHSRVLWSVTWRVDRSYTSLIMYVESRNVFRSLLFLSMFVVLIPWTVANTILWSWLNAFSNLRVHFKSGFKWAPCKDYNCYVKLWRESRNSDETDVVQLWLKFCTGSSSILLDRLDLDRLELKYPIQFSKYVTFIKILKLRAWPLTFIRSKLLWKFITWVSLHVALTTVVLFFIHV